MVADGGPSSNGDAKKLGGLRGRRSFRKAQAPFRLYSRRSLQKAQAPFRLYCRIRPWVHACSSGVHGTALRLCNDEKRKKERKRKRKKKKNHHTRRASPRSYSTVGLICSPSTLEATLRRDPAHRAQTTRANAGVKLSSRCALLPRTPCVGVNACLRALAGVIPSGDACLCRLCPSVLAGKPAAPPV